MAENASKLSIKTEDKTGGPKAATPQAWHPFETLHREVNRLFEDFGSDFWRTSFRQPMFEAEPAWRRVLGAAPAVDIVERDAAYEITADLPGMEEKDIEVKAVNGTLTITGERQEQKEEKKNDYYLHERRYGSFERSFRIPDTVNVDRIEAQFKNGVLTVTLPKTAEAQKPVKKIDVKAA
jgi:HSP20 family protein